MSEKPKTLAEALKASSNRCPRCGVPILEQERACPDCDEYLFEPHEDHS